MPSTRRGRSKRTKAAPARAQLRALVTLLNEWDPAGLIAAGAPADEYECLAGPLLSRLARDASPGEIGTWLQMQLTEHFGCGSPSVERFARRVTRWYRSASANDD